MQRNSQKINTNLSNKVLSDPKYKLNFKKHGSEARISCIDFFSSPIKSHSELSTNLATPSSTAQQFRKTKFISFNQQDPVLSSKRMTAPIKKLSLNRITNQNSLNLESKRSSVILDEIPKKTNPATERRISIEQMKDAAFSSHFNNINKLSHGRKSLANNAEDNVYRKVFDKKYYFLINPRQPKKINKYLIDNPNYVSEHARLKVRDSMPSYISSKIKNIKEKVFFIKGIFDYSYPKILNNRFNECKINQEAERAAAEKSKIKCNVVNPVYEARMKNIQNLCTISNLKKQVDDGTDQILLSERISKTTKQSLKNSFITSSPVKKESNILQVRLSVLKDKGKLNIGKRDIL